MYQRVGQERIEPASESLWIEEVPVALENRGGVRTKGFGLGETVRERLLLRIEVPAKARGHIHSGLHGGD